MINYTLITGACGGLGKSFVKLLANENLLLVGTNQAKLDALADDFDQILNKNTKTFVCNLAKSEDRQNLIDFINKSEINVNKLVNNAGVIIEGDLLKCKDEEIVNAIEVNCIGTLDLTQKIIKNRDENQKLEILTVASLASEYPIPHMAVYAATKSFLVSMMTALSVELKGKNVVFSTVCPSGMATTKAMQESIKSMGFSGKITTLSTDKVAKIALKGLKKGKAITIPGTVNKIASALSKPLKVATLAKITGRIYGKSQKKRGI